VNGDIDYERIRARVEQRLKKRRKFMSNLASAATGIAILWAIWFFTGGGWPWPLIPTGIIGIVAIREFLETFVFSPAMENAYDREMQREIARERARLGMRGSDTVFDDGYAKPKRAEKAKRQEPWVRLSDDGELVPMDKDDEAESEPRADHINRQ
jgi:hypothetical protein